MGLFLYVASVEILQFINLHFVLPLTKKKKKSLVNQKYETLLKVSCRESKVQYIQIYRFSKDGFLPKVQDYHYEMMLEYLEKPPDMKRLNKYQQGLIQEALVALKQVVFDWNQGVFVFVGFPTQQELRLELNHLSLEQVTTRNWYKAKIVSTAKVYSVYDLIPQPYVLGEFVKIYPTGSPCYIPSNQSWVIETSKL
jgi:hypothetical protein